MKTVHLGTPETRRTRAQTENGAQVLATGLQWLRKQYWLGVIPAVIILIVHDLIPVYLTDDPVRLVSLKRVVDPSFLSHEWLQLAKYDEDRLTILFKFIFAPLWILLKSAILVALSARIIVWLLLLYAIIRLARAMKIPRYALAFGLFYWVWQGQSMGVGEWIFGGAEGKCLAYCAIFLAIESLLRKRWNLAAVFCALSFWFHVPVGLWGALGIYGALLLSRPQHDLKSFVKPVLITFIIGLPMAWIAWKYVGVSEPIGGYPSTDWLIVVFRNPHHLDPTYFGGWRVLLKLCTCAALTVLSLRTLHVPGIRKVISIFISVLLLEFLFGLFARHVGYFWYLKTYPFRVSDVLIFFLCSLTLPKMIVELLSDAHPFRSRVAEKSIPRFVAVIFALLFLACTFSLGLSRSEKFFVRRFATSWTGFLRHDQSPYQEMTAWIRTNTPVDAVFIVPPWLDDFPLEAERAPVVNFRRNPHNGLILEWYHRYEAMNGGEFHSVGLATEVEVQKNYPRLSASDVSNIHRLFGAEYFLTETQLHDQSFPLVHANAQYYLYRLP